MERSRFRPNYLKAETNQDSISKINSCTSRSRSPTLNRASGLRQNFHIDQQSLDSGGPIDGWENNSNKDLKRSDFNLIYKNRSEKSPPPGITIPASITRDKIPLIDRQSLPPPHPSHHLRTDLTSISKPKVFNFQSKSALKFSGNNYNSSLGVRSYEGDQCQHGIPVTPKALRGISSLKVSSKNSKNIIIPSKFVELKHSLPFSSNVQLNQATSFARTDPLPPFKNQSLSPTFVQQKSMVPNISHDKLLGDELFETADSGSKYFYKNDNQGTEKENLHRIDLKHHFNMSNHHRVSRKYDNQDLTLRRLSSEIPLEPIEPLGSYEAAIQKRISNSFPYYFKNMIKNPSAPLQSPDRTVKDDYNPHQRAQVFGDISFSEITERALRSQVFTSAQIQAQEWPILLSGRDIVSVATATNERTLSYVLPAIARVLSNQDLQPGDGPIALFLVPTRDLALRVMTVCEKLGADGTFRCACLYGGTPRGPQIRALGRGVNILIATPGRLMDMLDCRATCLRKLTYLVLDEADKILSMGFETQIQKIIFNCHNARQTLLFTEAWSPEVERLANILLKNPIRLQSSRSTPLVCHNLIQNVIVCSEFEKRTLVLQHTKQIINKASDLSVEPSSSIIAKRSRLIVFAATKRTADEITRLLRDANFPALVIDGDKSREERDWVLGEFWSGRAQIMVSTDVVARGLDLKFVKYILNYDMPRTIEEYFDRIRGMGGLGELGKVITYFTPDNCRLTRDLVSALRETGQVVDPRLEGMIYTGSSKLIQPRNFRRASSSGKLYQPYQ